MPIRRSFAVLLLLFAGSTLAADKPTDHNATVEKALAKTKNWPGVIRSSIGVTRLGTRIPCLVTKDDVDYGTKKKRILLIGGLDGSKASVNNVLAAMEWLYTSKEAAASRKTLAISAVPILNPDAWATGKGPGNLSDGNPVSAYPPNGPFYSTKTDPEAAYLWRWIGMHAPDLVAVFSENGSLAGALSKQPIARVGSTHSYAMRQAAKREREGKKTVTFLTAVLELMKIIDEEKKLRRNSQGPSRDETPLRDNGKSNRPAKQRLESNGPRSQPKALFERARPEQNEGQSAPPILYARKELQRRVARTPLGIATQLSKKYGHNLKTVAYIPALALIGRMRLGELTGDISHRKDVEKIVAPYVSGKKKTFGRRISGSQFPGHLVFGELARTEKDPAKRKRYIELARRAADMGFDKDGKPRAAMPAHSEMSDAVFMGCPILVQVGRLTGETKYYDMALRHMRFMLKLNLRKDGLHRHSPLNETAWGRGNGFPALGLALCLSDLPKNHPGRKEMLAAFRHHMAAMAQHQDYTGAWHQVVDHPESYRELTVTCMTTFAMIRGIRNGWLDEKTYRPIVERAWTAIKTRVAPDGSLVDVCTGTGKQKSLRAYYDRTAILGYDARGGAMALMVTTEMAAWVKERRDK